MSNFIDEFELDKDSAAIVFSPDGKVNLLMPKMVGEDATIDPTKDQHVFTAMAIMMALNDDDMRKLVGEKINFILETADAIDGKGCSPEGGCPSCGGCGGH